MKRYERNKPIITGEKQRELKGKTVAVIGIGALGGYLAQGAVRLGIGNIVLIDKDVFSETNLNRQLFSNEETLGKAKVAVAKRELLKINSQVNIKTHQKYIKDLSDSKYFEGADMILDGLDNIASRRIVQKIAMALEIPYVHGAIGDWDGQAALLTPDRDRIADIYQDLNDDERQVANLVVMPTLISARQLALMVQYFIDAELVEKNVLRRVNLKEYYEIPIDFN